ncbi:SagB/ThcOx family dehydrogenase [uncultured Tateyamaria sp.]|uniref:SagB/ThcOx family dehydrogenase n=1 Tax=uncultured Tateyamaria sp. TaxID=455651 RepID=UPI0026288EF9|nr:SagB/ThcOx family dehydrogenase [uncultured Tateyamaria sp.]
MMIPANDQSSLSLLYHLNSEPWRNDQAYTAEPYVQEFPLPDPSGPPINLPKPKTTALSQLIAGRRSVRAFSGEPLSLDALSSVLHAAYGLVSADPQDTNLLPLRRSVPSAGGSYALDVYVFTQSVSGMEDGLYFYDGLRGRMLLRETRDGFEGLDQVFYTHGFVAKANALVCLAARFEHCQSKYGPRGYRYMLLEAGHAAQNICLTSVDLALGSLVMGGYVDSALLRELKLDPLKAGVLYSVAIGHPQDR